MVLGGGFPREDDPTCRRAQQRAIYHVQRELEVVGDSHNPAVVLCDRGTLDGLAYWPGPWSEFWESVGSTLESELARYDTVIHLRTPGGTAGYNHLNPLRTETAELAAQIDARILQVWEAHARRFIIESTDQFLDKMTRALDILRDVVPECCRSHALA